MTRILTIIFFCRLFVCCNSNPKTENLNTKDIELKSETSKNCETEKFSINSIKTLSKTNKVITQPIAVEFFELYHKILKYDGKFMDSLPEKVKHDNRQTIYKTIDQYGIYDALVKPVLDSMAIKTIVGHYQDSVLSFSVDNSTYHIDITNFKENDGVILFNPNKKPILWTTDCNTKTCSERDFIKHYFK